MAATRTVRKRLAETEGDAFGVSRDNGLITLRDAVQVAPSLTRAVYDALRDEVLSGRILPDEKIPIADTAARYGVSLSSVREALSRLVADGLVRAHDQRGFRASPVSVADLRDVIRVRTEIESLALRDSIENGDTDWEARILAAHHMLSKARPFDNGQSGRVSDDWMLRHKAFHRELLSASTSPWLLRISAMLFDQTERYRRLLGYIAPHDRGVDDEHREILEAFLAHDKSRATILIAHHFEATAASLIAKAATDLSDEGRVAP